VLWKINVGIWFIVVYAYRLARAVEADNNDGKLVFSESQSISISTGKEKA
jgi:hypothetical protein